MSETDSMASSVAGQIAAMARALDCVFPGVAFEIEFRAKHEGGSAVSGRAAVGKRQQPGVNHAPKSTPEKDAA